MRAALGFLTILGGATRPDSRAPRWFAPVGGLIGLTLGAAWWGADRLWPPLLAATLVVALDAVLTGMLHLDGLADTGDGLLAPMERQRRLAVMREPSVGAFGVVVLAIVLLLRVGALVSLAPDLALLAGLWGASRGLMAVVLITVPYARTQVDSTDMSERDEDGSGAGLATAFTSSPAARVRTVSAAVAGTGVALVVVGVAGGIPAGLAAAAGLVVGGAAVVGLAYRRLDGFTGDVLGAAGVFGETCGLLLAAAQW